MATGVFVWNLLRLPRLFPSLAFEIEYLGGGAAAAQSSARRAAGAPTE
jgi:hypothetical protein